MTTFVEWVTALTGVGAAVAAAFAARSSEKALESWKEGLKNQRVDELVIAMEICAASIGRAIAIRAKRTSVAAEGGPINEAWDKWSAVKGAYTVASRYYEKIERDFVGEGEAFMHDLTNQYNDVFAVPMVAALNARFGQYRSDVTAVLTRRPWGSGLRP